MSGSDKFERRDNPHISISAFREATQYAFPARAQKRKPLRQDYKAHSAELLRQLRAALGNIPSRDSDTRLRIEGLKVGSIVEVVTSSQPEDSHTKAIRIPSALEFPNQEISVLRTERRSDRSEAAIVFIPDDARDFLSGRIAAYGRDRGNVRPPDLERFEALESILAAHVRSLFVGDVNLLDKSKYWWEIWITGGRVRAERIGALARDAGLDVHSDRLVFPEMTVTFIHATARRLVDFISDVPGAVAEIRAAKDTIEPFLKTTGGGLHQHDWVLELAERVSANLDDCNAVCALDTGVSAGHPLLVPGLAGAWAYDQAWGSDDHCPHGGHGTGIAGLILYGDLDAHLSSVGPVALTHDVESMKLLPPNGFPPTEPPRYGVVTQGCVALVETERPAVLRSFCLASSTCDFPPSRPSSWSGALDQISAGAMPGDVGNGAPSAPKRLIVVATGNVESGPLAQVEMPQPLEDPSQSWNALTIGGFTRKDQVPAPPPVLTPVVPANHRSPFSRGSNDLPADLIPIKPEVLFEAGNMLYDGMKYCSSHDAVSLLALGSDVTNEPLIPFYATSAAVGLAGNFVGRLQAALPDLWPETHRALIVDSANWPEPIRQSLIGKGAHWKSGPKSARQRILREVGFGVPNFARAIASAQNDTTLIAEAEIQPFAIGTDGKTGVFNEMHFYDLPLPRGALERLENAIVTMKVTLSYFVEPNLTGRAATRPDTYRSFGLRFAIKRRKETKAAFRARVNAAQSAGEKNVITEGDYWLLGANAHQAGSLHCDVWRGHAVDLSGHDLIAVYPVGGWWKSHTGQRRVSSRGRYSLIISISAAGQSVDLYSEISAAVAAKVSSEVQVQGHVPG